MHALHIICMTAEYTSERANEYKYWKVQEKTLISANIDISLSNWYVLFKSAQTCSEWVWINDVD